ncbi:MAG: hypothetical protein AAF141_11835 [Pseudomonadota bacterium]
MACLECDVGTVRILARVSQAPRIQFTIAGFDRIGFAAGWLAC